MTSRRRTSLLCFAICAVVLFSACSAFKSLADLSKLQKQIREKYQEQKVGVNLRGAYLSIVFVNSPLNQMDRAARDNRAQETAKFVVASYPAIKQVRNLGVTFTDEKSQFIFFQHFQTLDLFLFNNRGEPLATDRETSNDPRRPVVKYNRVANQTDISIMRLQLDGDLNNGVALVPHYVAAGNAQEGKLEPPAQVTLDFASYSNQKIFTSNPDLEIRADNVTTVKSSGRLLSSAESGSDDTIAQFVTVHLPFEQFEKIAKARAVKITLGKKNFDLSDDDLVALRALCSYVR